MLRKCSSWVPQWVAVVRTEAGGPLRQGGTGTAGGWGAEALARAVDAPALRSRTSCATLGQSLSLSLLLYQ